MRNEKTGKLEDEGLRLLNCKNWTKKKTKNIKIKKGRKKQSYRESPVSGLYLRDWRTHER